MAELAESAANGSLSPTQRRTLAKEYQELDREIRRLTGATRFNEIRLLEGNRSVREFYSSPIDYTNTVGGEALSSDGRYLAYRTAGNAVVQLDRATNTLTTVFSGTASGSPVQSADGSVIVYRASNDLFKWDRRTGLTTQLTNAQGAETYNGVSISSDGGSVAFTAVTQYQNGAGVSAATTTGSQRIFHLDLSSGIISTVGTNVAGTFNSFQLSPDGSRLVFTSTADLLGTNGDANREVYAANFSTIGSPSYSQITQTAGTNITLARIADGGQIYIATTLDLGGVNPGGRSNIMKYTLGSGSWQRLTGNTSAFSIDSITTSTDGSLISFASNANLVGENNSNQLQLYQLDTVLGELRQTSPYVTTDQQMISMPVISRDGGTALLSTWNGIDLPAGNWFVEFGNSARNLVLDPGNGSSGTISVSISDLLASLRGLSGFAISAQSGARGALDRIRENLEILSSMRGTIGAGMTRLATADRLLSTQTAELTGAHSRIVDADVAGEMAVLTRSQILQQTGAALLASSRLQPSIALQLLNA